MHFRQSHHLGQGGGNLFNRRNGCTRRGKQAVIRQVFKSGQAQFCECRHIRQYGLARRAHDCHHPDLARFVVFNKVGNRSCTRSNLVAQHVTHHGCATPVGCGLQVQLVLLSDHLDQKFRNRCGCRDAYRAFAPTLAANPAHIIGEGLGGRTTGQCHCIDKGGEAAHGDEVACRVKAGILHDQRQDRHRVVVRKKKCRAIGRCGLECLRCDLPARAGLVLHDDRRAQLVFELVGKNPGDCIRAPARWKTDHDFDRAGLRLREPAHA